MPLRWKIWLSVFGIVTGLFGVAGYMLQRHAVESATLSLEEEVQAGFQAYESVLKARQEMIGSAALLLSSLPNVRAAFGTGDPATIRDSAMRFFPAAGCRSLDAVTLPRIYSTFQPCHLNQPLCRYCCPTSTSMQLVAS